MPGGARMIPAGARGGRDLRQRHRPAGHTHNTKAAIAQFEISAIALQEVGGDCTRLRQQPHARMVERGREGHGAATGDGAEAHWDGGGIGERDDHIIGRDLPLVGCDLGEDRLHPLTLGARA